MKHFLSKTVIFILIGLGAFHVKSLYLYNNGRYKKKVSYNEVYLSIDKSKQKSKARKVLLGDSVGKQLFDNNENNDTINSLACNQAISLAGQYFLLHNYIAAGNKIDTAYVFFVPFSFNNNLNQIYAYNYFVKPFYRDEYKPLMTPLVKRQIAKIPYTEIAWYPGIVTNGWSPDYNAADPVNYTFLAPVSIEYLHQMAALAKENHFKLVMRCGPISYKRKNEVAALDQTEISKSNLQAEFEGYFESITYLDESNFSDGIHLKHPEQYKNKYRNMIR